MRTQLKLWNTSHTHSKRVCVYDRIKRINWPQQHSCIYVNSCVNSSFVRWLLSFYFVVFFPHILFCCSVICVLQFSVLVLFTFGEQWLSVYILERYKSNRFGQFKKWFNAAKENEQFFCLPLLSYTFIRLSLWNVVFKSKQIGKIVRKKHTHTHTNWRHNSINEGKMRTFNQIPNILISRYSCVFSCT